jgi:hypothetical protein
MPSFPHSGHLEKLVLITHTYPIELNTTDCTQAYAPTTGWVQETSLLLVGKLEY